MKICKLVIDNLEGQETSTNSLESNENKGHETTDSIQLQKQRSQSSNKYVNQNDKSETLLHNNRAICCDRNEINREEKSTGNEDKNPKTLIRCPICLNQIADKDCIECTRCFMWIRKMCTDLTQEQFIKQSDGRNMEYTCTLCRTMDDDLIQCELEQDREGTYTPDNSSQNDFIDHIDNTYTTDKRKDKFTIHMENQIINDNEETSLKFIVQNEAIRTDDNKHISEESEANNYTNATKLRKPERNKHSILTNNWLFVKQELSCWKSKIENMKIQ